MPDLASGRPTAERHRQDDRTAHAGAPEGVACARGGGTRGAHFSSRPPGPPRGHRSVSPVAHGSTPQSTRAAFGDRSPGRDATCVRQRVALARPPRRRPRCDDRWRTGGAERYACHSRTMPRTTYIISIFRVAFFAAWDRFPRFVLRRLAWVCFPVACAGGCSCFRQCALRSCGL